MVGYEAAVTSTCQLAGTGQLGAKVAEWMRLVPATVLWMSAYGKGLYDTDLRLYTMLWANMVFLTYGVVWWLSEDVTRQPPPHPACTSDSVAMPSSEAAVLASYLVMTLFHQLALRCPTRWLPAAWMGAISIGVCASLLVNGQCSASQLAAGLGVGVACSLVSAYLLYVHAMPRFGLMLGDVGEHVFRRISLITVPRRYDPDAWSFY